MENPSTVGEFGSEFPRLALENVYETLWARPGLGLRDRSLVTLGILIGLRAEQEMRSHFAAALRNGLTREEIEEVIYHATGYAGFPAAARARAIAADVVAKESYRSPG
jgi:4-carboxymuconolactone decarboxylase